MDQLTTSDIILAVLYLSGAILSIATAHFLLLKRARRKTLQEVSAIQLITSKDNRFNAKTTFLIEVRSPPSYVQLDLLDQGEALVKQLFRQNLTTAEHLLDFDPTEFKPGTYYLRLMARRDVIFRKITLYTT